MCFIPKVHAFIFTGLHFQITRSSVGGVPGAQTFSREGPQKGSASHVP